jgi:hypothetical protein
MRTPYFAPIPVPTITAVGVANPNAHGHDITKHEIPNNSENVEGDSPFGKRLIGTAPVWISAYHTINVTTDKITTVGTKIPEILSANS